MCVLVSAARTSTRHLQEGACLCNGAAMDAPTDRASLQLLHGAWRRWTQDSTCVLVSAAGTLQQGTCRCVLLRRSRHETSN